MMNVAKEGAAHASGLAPVPGAMMNGIPYALHMNTIHHEA